MTAQQEKNISYLVDSMNRFGITNQHLQAGILATISKESNFIPQSENLNYSYSNIKRVFPYISDSEAQTLANKPEALGNRVYGGKYGNASNEGYKYRGRGFNQITFKANYDRFGKLINKDLVSNPDLLNDAKIAADAAAAFFATELKAGQNAGSFSKFGVTNVNDIKDTTTATKVAIQINAGRGTNFNNNIVQEGYKKALAQVEMLFGKAKSLAGAGVEFTKKNIIPISISILVLGTIIYLIVANRQQIIS